MRAAPGGTCHWRQTGENCKTTYTCKFRLYQFLLAYEERETELALTGRTQHHIRGRNATPLSFKGHVRSDWFPTNYGYVKFGIYKKNSSLGQRPHEALYRWNFCSYSTPCEITALSKDVWKVSTKCLQHQSVNNWGLPVYRQFKMADVVWILMCTTFTTLNSSWETGSDSRITWPSPRTPEEMASSFLFIIPPFEDFRPHTRTSSPTSGFSSLA